ETVRLKTAYRISVVTEPCRRNERFPSDAKVHRDSRSRAPRVLDVEAEVRLVLAERLGHSLPNRGELSEKEVAEHITRTARGGAVDAKDTDRTRVSYVDPAIPRPCAAECDLMLPAGQTEIVADLKLLLPQMAAGPASAAAEAEEAGGDEVEVTRSRRICIDADVLRTEVRSSWFDDGDP